MRPHAYGMAVVLIMTLAGCAGEASPAPAPAVTVSSAAPASVPPSPPVAVQEPHTFVFSVTGKAKVTSITYVLDGRKKTVRSVKLPWRSVTDVPADGKLHEWSLTVQHGSGRVELVGLVDNAVNGRASGEASGGSVSGTRQVGGGFRG